MKWFECNFLEIAEDSGMKIVAGRVKYSPSTWYCFLL